MYETIVTAVGRVATTVATHRFGDGAAKASFRLACTERRRDWGSGNWVDGETLFITVICWRALAENVEASLRVGDPVVVRGRMRTRAFETEGRRATTVEMDATAIGPDLSRCTTVVTRTTGGSTRPTEEQRRQEEPAGAVPRQHGERDLVGAAAGSGGAAGAGSGGVGEVPEGP